VFDGQVVRSVRDGGSVHREKKRNVKGQGRTVENSRAVAGKVNNSKRTGGTQKEEIEIKGHRI